MLFSRFLLLLIVCLSSGNNLATASTFSKTIEFIHSASNRNSDSQTTFLLDTAQLATKGLTNPPSIQLNTMSDMFQVSKLFDRFVFLTLRNKQSDYKRRCELNYQHDYLLELAITSGKTIVSTIQLDVALVNEEPCPVYSSNIQLNIEYIFQLGNASDYGLIKDDMSKNGIVAIVKIKDQERGGQRQLELRTDAVSECLAIKKFLPNFYMVRLAKRLDMAVDAASFEVLVHVTGDQGRSTRILTSAQLKFKLAKANDLRVQFKDAHARNDGHSSVNLSVNNFFRTLEFSEAYLYQVN